MFLKLPFAVSFSVLYIYIYIFHDVNVLHMSTYIIIFRRM